MTRSKRKCLELWGKKKKAHASQGGPTLMGPAESCSLKTHGPLAPSGLLEEVTKDKAPSPLRNPLHGSKHWSLPCTL